MDLSKRMNLSDQEKLTIAEEIHYIVLDEAFKAGNWNKGDAVLHGGTSLKLGYGSNRGSEDLDFIVSEDKAPLADVMGVVKRRLEAHFERTTPGALIEVNPPNDQEQRLTAWDIRWTHPNRRGKTLVRAEFWKVPNDIVRTYASRVVTITDRTSSGLRVTTPFPMAEMRSIWADKVVAIANRPSLKWRDAYDLAFVAEALHRRKEYPDENDVVSLVAQSAAVYNRDLQTVVDEVRTLLASCQLDDVETFAKDLKKWLDPIIYESSNGNALFEDHLNHAKRELTWIADTIETHLNAVPTP